MLVVIAQSFLKMASFGTDFLREPPLKCIFRSGSCIETTAERAFLETVYLLQPPPYNAFLETAPLRFSGVEFLTKSFLKIHF